MTKGTSMTRLMAAEVWELGRRRELWDTVLQLIARDNPVSASVIQELHMEFMTEWHEKVFSSCHSDVDLVLARPSDQT